MKVPKNVDRYTFFLWHSNQAKEIMAIKVEDIVAEREEIPKVVREGEIFVLGRDAFCRLKYAEERVYSSDMGSEE